MQVISFDAVLDDGSDYRPGVPTNPRFTLRITKGATVRLLVTVLRPSGVLVDLDPEWAMVFTVKKKPDLPDYAIRKVGDFLTERGKATVELSAADTKNLDSGRYLWDLWLEMSEGNADRQPIIPTSPLVLESSVTNVP
jgi:hypothetical protein